MNREYFYCIGLIYSYMYANKIMVLKDDLDKFYNNIKNSLYYIDNPSIYINYDNSIYYSVFINNKIYYVLKQNLNINDLISNYIIKMPLYLLIISRKEEVLNCIGLSKNNNSIVKKIKKRTNISSHNSNGRG